MIRSRLFALLALAGSAAASPPPPADHDTPEWRAEHGVLLGLATAGTRLVAVGDRGTVLLSDDAGTNWHLTKSGFSGLLTAIAFADARAGLAVGQDGEILATDDAGEHWREARHAANSDQSLFAVTANAGHWLVTGGYALMFESDDAKVWTQTKLPELDEDYHLNGVAARGQDVLLAAESGQDLLRRAGAWQKIPVPYNGSQFGCLIDPRGTLYSFGLRGSFFVRPANATTWTRLDLGTQSSIFGGAFLPDGRIALVGANGLVLLVDPEKQAHQRLRPPSHASLSGVAQAGEGRLVVVGDDGIHTIGLTDLAEAATQ